ncbi:MAG: hypothetical protein ABIO40_05345 [Devosia sp.]
MRQLLQRVVALILASLLPSGLAAAEEWRTYTDPQQRFAVDLPVTSFEMTDDAGSDGHLTLSEIGGTAIIDIFFGNNLKRLSPAAFADRLSHAGLVKDITYQTGGRTWFVLSGHYRQTGDEPPLIYYAKYLFTADLEQLGGFEISYSVDDKHRLGPIVERIEASFRLL